MNPEWIPQPKICRKLRTWSCGHKKKLRLRNCGVAVAEQHFFKKLWNCDYRSASFKLRNCNCGLKKKLLMPTSAFLSVLKQLPVPVKLWMLRHPSVIFQMNGGKVSERHLQTEPTSARLTPTNFSVSTFLSAYQNVERSVTLLVGCTVEVCKSCVDNNVFCCKQKEYS
jgi:hypothetical protein